MGILIIARNGKAADKSFPVRLFEAIVARNLNCKNEKVITELYYKFQRSWNILDLNEVSAVERDVFFEELNKLANEIKGKEKFFYFDAVELRELLSEILNNEY